MNHGNGTTLPPALTDRLGRLQRTATLAGLAGLGVCVLAWLVNPDRFFLGYMVGFLFWVGISIACLAVVMLHQLVGGIWGFVVRRPAEAGTMTIPLMALLFVPIALGLKHLYPWADPSIVQRSHELQHKALYLNVSFFLIRSVIYFAIWTGLALALNLGSSRQDRGDEAGPSRWLPTVSGPGLAAWFLAVTFAMIDWGMSLEPLYYSSIYAVMLMIGQILATLATLVIVASALEDVEPLREVARPEAFNDLGNLMLAFTMLWAYMSFSQYLITWSGNLTEEIPWYLHRSRVGWRYVAMALIFLHFFLPFFLLLGKDRKRRPASLAKVAWWILIMHLVDTTWLVIPTAADPNLLKYWSVAPAFIGIGGLWVAAFIRRLRSRPLLPLHDPLLDAVLAHHNHNHG
jgi:hypothetical protein